MNWKDIQLWKKSKVSTILCLIGCSIGTISTLYFLTGYYWIYSIVVSFIIGLITCVLFISIWNVVINRIELKDAIINSLKMSVASMIIIIGTENGIMLFTHVQHSAQEMNMNNLSIPTTMIIAMGFGFILALPYNYYILMKTGKICHEQ